MIVEKIPYINPEVIANAFADELGTIWLDSAANVCSMGDSSFIGVAPYDIWSLKNGILSDINGDKSKCHDPLTLLQEKMRPFICNNDMSLPRFQTGVAGLLSYNLHSYIEPIKLNNVLTDDFPDLFLGFYDLVMSFDHKSNECYIFANGAPYTERQQQIRHASKRVKWLKDKVTSLTSLAKINHTPCTDFAPCLDKEQYRKDVEKMIEYIYAGDIFEANLSQKFTCTKPNNLGFFDLYRRLRKYNPAPFAAMLNLGSRQILSSSPERFLYSKGKFVESRPIKGTIRRSKDKDEDIALANELLNSTKDHAENTMIVDLMRNDISRCCIPGSVKVPKLCGLESFTSVHHLVSVVQGELEPHKDQIDLLKACFPGGSITGAPKIRAMEIIYELEMMTRGPYCGSMVYLGNNQVMDSSILIRTLLCEQNHISFRAGGAIVSDSSPLGEYDETLVKAKKLKEALLAL